MEQEVVVKVENISKSYGEQKVLQGISMELHKGKIYGLIGRNGSGKTVIMKWISGFVVPDTGRVIVSGKEVGKENDMAENVGAIIETPGFLPSYSGYKNLVFLAMLKKKVGDERIRQVIEQVGLEPDSKKHVAKYSLGMRQRLGIAQAILENPDILILDEPMNGLDNQGVKEMRKLFLQQKKEGKTILLASHNRDDIEVLCDEVYEMEHGKMVSFEVVGEPNIL